MNRTISKKLISVFLSVILVIAFCVVPVSDYRTSEGDSVAEAQTYQEQIDDKKDELGDVKAEQKEKSVRISVFNTGKPIPEEDLDKIWIKFYKVDKARTREYGGSGIGLSIVKAIMDALNRGYGIENYSNGVSFWFELDCKDVGNEA